MGACPLNPKETILVYKTMCLFSRFLLLLNPQSNQYREHYHHEVRYYQLSISRFSWSQLKKLFEFRPELLASAWSHSYCSVH